MRAVTGSQKKAATIFVELQPHRVKKIRQLVINKTQSLDNPMLAWVKVSNVINRRKYSVFNAMCFEL